MSKVLKLIGLSNDNFRRVDGPEAVSKHKCTQMLMVCSTSGCSYDI